MRNFAKLSVGVAAAIGLAAATAFATVRNNGPAADRRPGRLEEAVAARNRHATAISAERTRSKTIAMDGARFDPFDLTVSVGATVKWINKDPYPHNVTSNGGGFQSGNLTPNREWRFRPSKRGTFEYVCTLHPGMKAVLRVK